MATDVELPQLGESVTEGTVTAWLVEVGDEVSEDQPLFELSSDKIDTEVPSPAAGVITEILVQVDETVEVGTVVARIGSGDDAPADDSESDEVEDSDSEESGDADSDNEESADDDATDDDGKVFSDDDATEASESSGQEQAEAEAEVAQDSRSEDGSEDQAEDEDQDTDSGQGGGGGGGDAVDVILPELGESVTEGTITGWLVEVGDEVSEDDPLFELSSDKIDTEVPSPASGTVSEILVDVDETVEVGTVVARIGGSAGGSAQDSSADDADEGDSTDGERDDADDADEESTPEKSESTTGGYEDAPDDSSADTADAPAAPSGSDALASPLVRRLAKENDIDLDSLSGSGQGGRITRDDVESAMSGDSTSTSEDQPAEKETSSDTERAPAKKASKPSAKDKPDAEAKSKDGTKRSSKPAREPGDRETVEDLSRIRQRIAEKMLESQREAAQLTTVQECDVTVLMHARGEHKDAFKKREGVSLSPFAMVARAALMAVRNHPMVNAVADWEHGKLYKRDYVNLGIAVDTPKGLLVPNVRGADGLTVAGLARGISEAAKKARGEGSAKLDFSDIEGGTFTLTNTGSVGVLIDTPILNHPEVAILGVGAIKKRPAVIESVDGTEAIAVRQMMYLSLTYDHRLLDGADAARFVTEVKEILETTDWAQEVG